MTQRLFPHALVCLSVVASCTSETEKAEDNDNGDESEGGGTDGADGADGADGTNPWSTRGLGLALHREGRTGAGWCSSFEALVGTEVACPACDLAFELTESFYQSGSECGHPSPLGTTIAFYWAFDGDGYVIHRVEFDGVAVAYSYSSNWENGFEDDEQSYLEFAPEYGTDVGLPDLTQADYYPFGEALIGEHNAVLEYFGDYWNR